jgi:hypothetical protein
MTEPPPHTLEQQIHLRRQQLMRVVTPRPSEIRAAIKQVEASTPSSRS